MTSDTEIGATVAIALLHYPVYDKNHRIVATAITNLDIHDIARLAKTYRMARYYVVTPLEEQREIALKVANHWQKGWGAHYNPKRKAAFDLVTVVGTLEEAVEDLQKHSDAPVKLVATGAKGTPGAVSYGTMSEMLGKSGTSFLILLGTGWGLTDEVLSGSDYILEPIAGRGDYNHLAVRSAAAIIIDRLLGSTSY